MPPWIKSKNSVASNLNLSGLEVTHGLIISLVILLFGNFSVAESLKTGTASLSARSAMNSSVPLWGGGQLITSGIAEDSQKIKLHHFDNLECGTCHKTSTVEESDTSSDQNIWKTGVDINKSCSMSSCHSYEESMNHPVGVTVLGSLPEHMKTDSSSKLTCLTCHENAEPDPVFTDEDEQNERFLHKPDSRQLCSTCHASNVQSAKSNTHWQFSNKAHLKPLNPANIFSHDNSTQMFASLDEETNNCLSCHDEVTATIPAMNETRQQRYQRYHKMSDHPVGMNYRHKSNSSMGSFNYPMDNSDVIRLFEGRVGCGSCHSMYSKKESYLVTEKGGALCRSCHIR